MSDVLAINVDQPYASLLAHGIKGWETRPHPPAGWPGIPEGTRRMPGCRITPDDDVLIVSSRKRVTSERVPEGWFYDDETGAIGGGGFGSPFGAWRSYPAPLGAVLGVGRVTDVVPIVDNRTEGAHICHQHGRLAYFGDPRGLSLAETLRQLADISDQLPYGDWSPGRWAWRMEVRGLTEPVTEYPACPFGCVASGTIHECSPESRALCVEPVRGRQGVWRPDPALVAAVREVPDAN